MASQVRMKDSSSPSSGKNEIKEPAWKSRYAFILIGFFVFFYINGCRLNMSVTLVGMVNITALTEKTSQKSESCRSLILNITAEDPKGYKIRTDGEFIWSPKLQGYILSSYYIGFVMMQIPGGVLVERFGTKWFLFSCSFITSVCTLMIPVLSTISAWAFVAVNVIRGVAQGVVRPSMSVLVTNWLPKMERGSLIPIMMSGSAFGSFLTSVVSGQLCEYAGWPSSFYTLGGIAMVLSICIVFLIYENPNVHPRISKAEKDFILNNQECVLAKRRPNVPWRKILTSVPVYAMSLACFGQYWATSHFSIVHATYLGTILHYPIGQNGIFSALPFLLQFLAVQTTAFVSSYLQKKNIASVDSLRKINTLISCVGCSACFLGIYLAGCDRRFSIVASMVAMGFIGCAFNGCWIVFADMSPQFAGSLNAFCLTFACSSSVILPLIVGYLTNEMQTIEQWSKVMLLSMGVVLTTGIIFVIFGSAEVQPWNFVEQTESKNSDETKGKVKKELEVTRF